MEVETPMSVTGRDYDNSNENSWNSGFIAGLEEARRILRLRSTTRAIQFKAAEPGPVRDAIGIKHGEVEGLLSLLDHAISEANQADEEARDRQANE